MGPMPDRFLAYLISGDREEWVTSRDAIAGHERAVAFGTIGAVQLLSEGASLPDDVLSRIRRLLRALEPPPMARLLAASYESFDFGAAEAEALFEPPDAMNVERIRTAARQGLAQLADVHRRPIELLSTSHRRTVHASGIDVVLSVKRGDVPGSQLLELALSESGEGSHPDATALLWSDANTNDAQRTAFDPAGTARLRWPPAPRNTLRIDAGPHTALIDLRTAA